MYYTKYRPLKFSDLISKPNDVVHAISTQLKTQKTVHAYLFVGSRGTGKTTTARLLAKALNCTALGDNGDPCGVCDACVGVQNGSYMDLIEIDAASNRGIDDIRELKEKIRLAPSKGVNKVYIVDEVHMLTPEAFNALLKTLEEPPKHVTFILCTTEFHKVPETIRSRCQVFKFKRASIAQLVEKLQKIVKSEKIKIDDHSIEMIANAAQGGFRDAETLLQQVSEGDITVDALVNMGTKESYIAFTKMLINCDSKEALHHVTRLVDDGVDLYMWIGELLKYLRDLLYVKSGSFEEEGHELLLKEMFEQANTVEITVLVDMANLFIEAQNKIKDSFIVQLPLELAIIEICNAGDGAPRGFRRTADPEGPDYKYFKIDVESPKKVEKEVVVVEKEDESVSVPEEKEILVMESTNPDITLEVVTTHWQTIISEISGVNHTISALLKVATPVQIEGDQIILEVPYDFHRERLHSTKNRLVVETTIESVLEHKLRITCNVKKVPRKKKKMTQSKPQTGQLTDYNVVVPSGAPENVLEVFDGGLPF